MCAGRPRRFRCCSVWQKSVGMICRCEEGWNLIIGPRDRKAVMLGLLSSSWASVLAFYNGSDHPI